jgi:hypothetical protein
LPVKESLRIVLKILLQYLWPFQMQRATIIILHWMLLSLTASKCINKFSFKETLRRSKRAVLQLCDSWRSDKESISNHDCAMHEAYVLLSEIKQEKDIYMLMLKTPTKKSIV